MNKKIIKSVAVTGVLFSAAFFASCNQNEKNSSGEKFYTYNDSSDSPQTWSPTDYQMGSEGSIISLTSMGLYDFVLNESKDGSVVVCELASEFPQDVTKEYAGRYNIPQTADSGWVWKIDLNEKACWQDGTPINADTWEYSIKQFLNPEMKNYRASLFYQDTLALANAEKYYEGKGRWEDVGFIKNNDYSFTLILSKEQKQFFIEYAGASGYLVNPELYEANKIKTGDIIKSSYGTSVEKYSSCGPYKIVSYQNDKEMKLEKNEQWYGWTDGKHNDQFMTTGIHIQYIIKHETLISLFMQGKLDSVGLDANDLKLYGNSEFRQQTPESYTWKFSFNIDKDALKKNNVPGVNHVMLSYKDFRHGISLALDRQKYIDTISPASDVGFGLLNYLYIAEPETGALYRECPQAINAMCEFYGAKKQSDITGYDVSKASYYLEKAYKEALANGDILPEEKIQIDYHTYSTNDTNIRSVAFLQDSLTEAAKGTLLEGKIFVKQVTDENYYDNMKNGAVDCAMTGWGGSSYDPYGITWCYCVNSVRNEYGFDAEKEMLTININGRNETRSFYQWHVELNEGKYSAADYDVRNTILAAVEKGLLETYSMIPIRYLNSVGLISQRVI